MVPKTLSSIQKAPILVLFLVILTSVAAQDGRVLQEIRIEGLRRTDETVVLDIIDLQRGDPVDESTIRTVERELQKSDLFASVAVSATPRPAPGNASEVDLRITLEEKWTLVPVPFFSTGGDGVNGGLILIESNLFGRNKQLISAAFGGTDGARGFFVYADPSVSGGPWSASVSAAGGRSDVEALRPDGEVIRRFTTDDRRVGLGIGYGITSTLRIRSRLSVSTSSITDFRGGTDDRSPEDGWYLEPEISLDYDGTRPVDVLMMGPEASVGGSVLTPEEGWRVRGDLSWGVPVFGTHRARIVGSGGYGAMPVLNETLISDRDAFRTLPYQATYADRWAGGSVIYDLPVVSTDWGAFVLSHYWEAGAFDSDALDGQLYYGPGGGFRVYIRRVAIPALGLDVAYNMVNPAWVFSFTVGARM